MNGYHQGYYPQGSNHPQGLNYPHGSNHPQGQNYPNGSNHLQGKNYPPHGSNNPQGQNYPNESNNPQGQNYPNGSNHPQGQNYPHGQNYPQGHNYPHEQNMPPQMNSPIEQPNDQGYFNNFDQSYPYNQNQDFGRGNPNKVYNDLNSPENTQPLDIEGLGNYPEEWMHAMPDPGYYVEVPTNMEFVDHPQFGDSPLMHGQPPGNNFQPLDPIYQDNMPNDNHIPMDMHMRQGSQVIGPEVQSVHSMVPNVYVNQYQDDCLYLNLEEEYLHKVSLQNKNDTILPMNQRIN